MAILILSLGLYYSFDKQVISFVVTHFFGEHNYLLTEHETFLHTFHTTQMIGKNMKRINPIIRL